MGRNFVLWVKLVKRVTRNGMTCSGPSGMAYRSRFSEAKRSFFPKQRGRDLRNTAMKDYKCEIVDRNK